MPFAGVVMLAVTAHLVGLLEGVGILEDVIFSRLLVAVHLLHSY